MSISSCLVKTCRLKDYSPNEDCDRHVWVDNVDLCDRCLQKRLKEIRPEASPKSGLIAKYIDTFIVAVITAAGTYAFGDMSGTTEAAKTVIIVKDEQGRTCGRITIGGEQIRLPDVPAAAPETDSLIMRRSTTAFDGDPPLLYFMGAREANDATVLSDEWVAFGRSAWAMLSARTREVQSRSMHGRAQAEAAIRAFLAGKDRVLLLDGTFQNEKHRLALKSVIADYPAPASVLFCSGIKRQLESLLAPLGIKPKPGGVPLGGHVLHTQTKLAKSTIKRVDVAIVYPLDSFGVDEGTACVADFCARGAKKILLVTWTDNRDLGWVDQYSPARVTFDAEEERADYHERMQEHVAERRVEVPRNLPAYAKNADPEKLVNLDCRHCKKSRWAEMNVHYPGKDALQNEDAGYEARCLVCGNVDHYSSDWYGRP